MRKFFAAVADTIRYPLVPRSQVRWAWLQFVATIIVAPISVFTFAKDEPVTVLLLSWWAILITAMNYISAAQANNEVNSEDADVDVSAKHADVDINGGDK